MTSKRNANRRPQTPKGRQVKVVKSGSNPEYVQGMQGLRRSNATVPLPSGKRYVRRTRNNQTPEA